MFGCVLGGDWGRSGDVTGERGRAGDERLILQNEKKRKEHQDNNNRSVINQMISG